MFKVKPYVLLVAIVGSLFLVYGMTFLSSKFIPITNDTTAQGNTLMVTLTEGILLFSALLVLAVGGAFYYMKSRFEDHRHKH